MTKANEALDKMADNARELGLDYEPAQKRPQNCGTGYCSCIECVMEPAQYSDIVSDGSMDPRNEFDKPAQRTWVGLTDEEMDDCWNKLFGTGNYYRRNVYLAVEAKLKEKNT